MRTHAALLLLGGATIACAGTTVDPEPSAPPAELAPHTDARAEPADPAVHHANGPTQPSDELAPLLREITADYRSWGMVDDQFHWAPGMCAMPAQGVTHYSTADSSAAHAQKVFLLYATDPMGYWKATDVKGRLPASLAHRRGLKTRADVAQVLVKESFVPAKPGEGDHSHGHVAVRPAKQGGEIFVAGAPMGLFVMAQLLGEPAGTDEGWLYATVAPDGTITASGVIASCRDCHAKEADRIFGVPLAWQ